jgi:hypothetical protein
MGWATLLSIFSQAREVTLLENKRVERPQDQTLSRETVTSSFDQLLTLKTKVCSCEIGFQR